MAYLDTQRFDRLSEKEVLDRIGTLLAIAIGRHEQQRQLATLVGVPQAGGGRDQVESSAVQVRLEISRNRTILPKFLNESSGT